MNNPRIQNKVLKTFLMLALELEEEPIYPLTQPRLTKIETLLLERLSQGDIHERQVLFVRLLCGFENNGNPRSLRQTQQHRENKWNYSKARISNFLAQVIGQLFGEQHVPQSMKRVLPKNPRVWQSARVIE